MPSATATHPPFKHVDKRRPPDPIKDLPVLDPRTKSQRPHVPIFLVQGDHQSDSVCLHLSQGDQSLVDPGSGFGRSVMLIDLPNHLSSHMASRIANMSVEIGEYIFVLGIGEEDVVGRVGEGKYFEGILDSLETVEDMEQSPFQVLTSRFFGGTDKEKGSHYTRGVGASYSGLRLLRA